MKTATLIKLKKGLIYCHTTKQTVDFTINYLMEEATVSEETVICFLNRNGYNLKLSNTKHNGKIKT